MERPVATSESLSEFRSTYEGHLRVLKAPQCDVEESGYVFAHLLLTQLPLTTKDNINRAKGNEIWTLPRLRQAINDEISYLNAVQHNTSVISSASKETLHTAAVKYLGHL